MKKIYQPNRVINVDTNVKCTLQCPSCKRTDFKEKFGQNVPIPGRNITVEEIEKLLKFYKGISFCGQHSDPIFSPYLIDMLKLCYERKCFTDVHTAATGRPKKWYREAFLANPTTEWWFGIDGLPSMSNLYRKNQKSEHLFEMMCLAKELGVKTVVWKYIIFNYNQDYVDDAKQLADKHNLRIDYIIPSRSLPEELMPTKPEYIWSNYV